MLFLIFISPTFATEITDPATCDSGTLSTDTGSTNLRANYESNVLNLKFYDNNTLLDVSSTNSGTCTYGTPINLPTAPTKRGYTFKGWKVEQQYDFTNLNTSNNGSERWGKNESVCHHALVYNNAVIVDCVNGFLDLNSYEWKVNFNYGMVYGMSKCTNVSGTWAMAGNPGNEDGKYCWCRATGYKATGTDTISRPLTNLSWIFYNLHGDYGSVSSCKGKCSIHCTYGVIYEPDFRRALYGQ